MDYYSHFGAYLFGLRLLITVTRGIGLLNNKSGHLLMSHVITGLISLKVVLTERIQIAIPLVQEETNQAQSRIPCFYVSFKFINFWDSRLESDRVESRSEVKN